MNDLLAFLGCLVGATMLSLAIVRGWDLIRELIVP